MADRTDNDFNPPGADYSAGHACHELTNGRTGWPLEHIKRRGGMIDPMVGRLQISLIDNDQPGLRWDLELVRRRGLPSAQSDVRQLDTHDFGLACEVAEAGGFERAQRAQFCAAVGKRHGLNVNTVKSAARRYQTQALDVLAKEQAEQAYLARKVGN